MAPVLVPYLCISGQQYSVYLLPDVFRPTPPAQQVIIRRASSADLANIDRWNKEGATAQREETRQPKDDWTLWATR